jgi:phospholipid transport system substrate-binding protein
MSEITKILKNAICITICIFTFCFSVKADEAQQAADFVSDIANQIIKVLDSKEDDKQKKEQLSDIFCKYVDIDWMGKFALGSSYRKLTKEQLVDYLSAYRSFLQSTYVSKFTKYNGQKFDLDGVKMISKTVYMVNTKIDDPNNTTDQVSVIYRIEEIDNKFYIRDVIVEGISLILGQRSDFSSVISNEGIDSLIRKLKNKGK